LKCTECGTNVKSIVAVDIDNTLCDYSHSLIRFASDWFGRSFKPAEDYDGSVDLATFLELDKGEYRAMKVAYRQGGAKRLQPPIVGAVAFMKWLRERDVEIWLTTTRPYLKFDSTDPDTRNWLERHGIPFDYLLYEEDKYAVLESRVDPKRIVMVVDDDHTQCERAADLLLPAVQLGGPWNEHPNARYWIRFISLESLRMALSYRLDTWRNNYA